MVKEMNGKNDNVSLLSHIKKTTDEAILGINNLEEKIKQSKFKEQIKSYKVEYQRIVDEVKEVLTKYGQTEKEISSLKRATHNIVSNAKTIKGESSSNISKILIGESKQYIKSIRKELYQDALYDEEIVKLAEKFITITEEMIEELKAYL